MRCRSPDRTALSWRSDSRRTVVVPFASRRAGSGTLYAADETSVAPYDPFMSMLMAAEVTAISTALLAVFALAAGSIATRALVLQARQVRYLKDDHEREAKERREAQASAVFMWEDRPLPLPAQGTGGSQAYPVIATVKNASDRPIYDLYFLWGWGRLIHQRNQRSPGGRLMPGEEVNDDSKAGITTAPGSCGPPTLGTTAATRSIRTFTPR
jgi:hypothetical protein